MASPPVFVSSEQGAEQVTYRNGHLTELIGGLGFTTRENAERRADAAQRLQRSTNVPLAGLEVQPRPVR